MRRIIAVLSSVVLLGTAAHGVGAQGKSMHGAAVATVAAGTCVAANPHNPKVKNHGQCVAQAARGASGKHSAGAKNQGKHLGWAKGNKGKGHAKAHQPGGANEKPEATDAPEPTEAPEPTDTP